MNEQSPRAVFERAVSLLKGGARQEAESLCRDMLERDPGDINFVSLLGSILASRGAHEEAVDLLTRAVKAAPGHAKAREDLGTLLLNLDRVEEALPHLERALEERRAFAQHRDGAGERLAVLALDLEDDVDLPQTDGSRVTGRFAPTSTARVGDTIEIKYYRDGEILSAEVQLPERPLLPADIRRFRENRGER